MIIPLEFYWWKFCWRYKIFPFRVFVPDKYEEQWSRYFMKWIKARNKRMK